MKAIDVDCPDVHCARIAGARCKPPQNGTHQSLPGKPDEWRYYHDERIAVAAERTAAARVTITKRTQRIRRTKAQMAADVAPNLFVTIRDRNTLIGLVRDARRHVTANGPSGRYFAKLATKLENVTW